jgi:GR25 family glycosyltransferase involved in LPS biosynthesis
VTGHYCIISIDNSRENYKETIRSRALGVEHHIRSINGNAVDLNEELKFFGMRVEHQDETFSKGEIGVWLSQMNCWLYAYLTNQELVVFEDDAIPTERFNEMILKYQLELPRDYDFCSLWVPENQEGDYLYDVDYDERGIPKVSGPIRPEGQSQYDFGAKYLTRVYQGYGLVATLFSPNGAKRLIRLAREMGIYTPVDCFLYLEAHKGNLNGFAPKPEFATAVTYDWAATSLRVTEGRFYHS